MLGEQVALESSTPPPPFMWQVVVEEPHYYLQYDREAAPAVPAKAAAMVRQYRRVGRDLVRVQNKRGGDLTEDLWSTYRAIHIDDALATADGRDETAATLADLHDKIERRQGVQLSRE